MNYEQLLNWWCKDKTFFLKWHVIVVFFGKNVENTGKYIQILFWLWNNMYFCNCNRGILT